MQNKHKEELESLKATAEAVYSSQLDEQLARSEHEKSQALVEQLEELNQRQEDEMAKMKEKYEEEMSEKEEQYKEQHGKLFLLLHHVNQPGGVCAFVHWFVHLF